MNYSPTHFDPYTFQSLVPDSTKFDDFVYLLQSCMNDEGLFTKSNMSRITVELPVELVTNPKKTSTPNLRKRHKFFGDFNLVSRVRYLFFCEELCLVIDQDTDIYFSDPHCCHGDLDRVTRRTYRLLLASSDLIRREALIQSRKNPTKATIMNGRAELDSEILQNHKEVVRTERDDGYVSLNVVTVSESEKTRVIIDLPDNLELFTSNQGRDAGYLSALLELLRLNIASLPNLFNDVEARELSTEEFIEYSNFQIDETSNVFMSLYEHHGINMKEAKEIGYDGRYWDREFELEKMTISWKNQKPYTGIGTSSLDFFYADKIELQGTIVGQFHIARAVRVPGINPVYYAEEESLMKAVETIVQYIGVFREDFLITSKKIKGCIKN